MKYLRIINSFIDENTYFIYENDFCLIVDPGSDFAEMVKIIEENQFKRISIYLTHGHSDHVASVPDLVEKYNCPVYTHKLEIPLLEKASLNLSTNFNKELEINYAIGIENELVIDNYHFILYHTPGHTHGHSMLEVKELNALFTGDFIFRHEIGRCDLPTGSLEEMYESLDRLALMDPSLKIYSGHGDMSDLKDELKNNRYLNRN